MGAELGLPVGLEKVHPPRRSVDADPGFPPELKIHSSQASVEIEWKPLPELEMVLPPRRPVDTGLGPPGGLKKV